ncbi:MAG TPA: hypothetical protein VGK03_08875 [Geothrix sp.]|jgi:hypothetical protein
MRTFVLSLLTLIGPTLAAEDYRAMAQVIQATWGTSPSLAVACNYDSNRESVQRLANAFGGACHVTVVDIRNPDHAGRAQGILIRLRPDLMVLMAIDPCVRDGSFTATKLVHGLRTAGIPSAGTSSAALKQGALFAIGEGTAGALLVNEGQVGTIGPPKELVDQLIELRNRSQVGATNLERPVHVRVISLK